MRALTADPARPQSLYAGLYTYGFLRSDDGGVTWRAFNDGLWLGPDSPDRRPRNVRALYVSRSDPNLIYLGSEGGLYRSLDRGENWELMFADVGNPHYINFFGVDALAGSLSDGAEIVYAGTKAGLFTLSPGDFAWQPTALLGDTFRTSAILVPPDQPERIFVGTQAEGIFAGQDWDANWTQIGQTFADNDSWVNKLALDAEGRLWAGTLGQGIFVQTGGGWQPMNDGLPPDARIWLLFAQPGSPELYASVADERSYRWNGAAWDALPFPHAFYSLLSIPGSDAFLAGTRGFGVYRSDDGMASWQPFSMQTDGSTAFPVNALLTLADPAEPNRTLLVAGTESNGVFVRPADRPTWQAGLGMPVTHRRISALALGGGADAERRLYAGTLGGGVYTSRDGAANWTQLPTAGLDEETPFVYSLAVQPGEPDRIYAGTPRGLYRFLPDEERWQSVAPLMSQLSLGNAVNALAVGPQAQLFAGVGNEGVFRSPDGESWQSLSVNLLEDPIFVSGFQLSRKTGLGRWLHGADRFFAIDYDSLYSSDTIFDPTRGAVWDRRITGKFGALAVDPFHPQILYAGAVTATVGVAITPTYPSLISLDNGATWQDAGRLAHPVHALAADPNRPGILYAGTTSGVYVGEVTLPVLWREVAVWGVLFAPFLLAGAFFGFVFVTLSLPYGVPLPTAARLLLFRRRTLALALAEPSPLSSLQQLILAYSAGWPVWTQAQMAAALDAQNANASSAQLAAALDQLTHQYGLLRRDGSDRYRAALPGLGAIFRRRIARNPALFAKDVREENAIFQDSRDFFRQAGFAVHARRDILLLTPLQPAWAELTSQRDDAPLLARILAGGPPTVADLDESALLAAAEYDSGLAGRMLFLVVSAAPDAAARRQMGRMRESLGLSIVLISHAALYQALGDGAASATLQIALRRHRGEISPAEISGPVLDPLDFFDRTELLAEIRERLAAGESLILSGPPQIGKSSLAWQAARRLDNHLISYAEFTAGPAWEAQMLGDLLDGLARDGSRKYPRTEWPFDPAALRANTRSMADFAGTLAGMGEAVSLRGGSPRLVLLVDGLSEATLEWWPQLLAATAAQPGLHVGVLGVLAAGTPPPAAGQNVAVGPFTPAAALEMAEAMADQAGIALDGEAAQALVDAGGGQPFLLRRLFGAAQLAAEAQARGSEERQARLDVASADAGIHRHVASNPAYSRVWASLSPAEQAALLAAATGEGVVDAGSARRLLAVGWLVQEGAGYRLAAGVLRVWLEWMGLL